MALRRAVARKVWASSPSSLTYFASRAKRASLGVLSRAQRKARDQGLRGVSQGSSRWFEAGKVLRCTVNMVAASARRMRTGRDASARRAVLERWRWLASSASWVRVAPSSSVMIA